MPIYEITITREATLPETWEAEAPAAATALANCRAARVAAGDHTEADVYTAVQRELPDDVAMAFAFFFAARRMPALYLLGGAAA